MNQETVTVLWICLAWGVVYCATSYALRKGSRMARVVGGLKAGVIAFAVALALFAVRAYFAPEPDGGTTPLECERFAGPAGC